MLFIFFYIFEDDYRINYIILGITALILIADIVKNGFKYSIRIHNFHILLSLFALLCFASTLWAWDSNYAIIISKTLLEILICVFVLYTHYYEEYDINILLKTIMYAGIVVAVYSLVYYGAGTVVSAVTNSTRLWNSFANINSIAMGAATSMIICIYYIIYKKQFPLILFLIPLLVLIFASGSRKALLMIFLGAIFLGMKRLSGRKTGSTIIKVFFFLVIAFALLKYLSTLPFFSGIMHRMEGLTAFITGKGAIDRSSLVRQNYITAGFQQFLKSPFLGIGIGNGRLVALQKFGADEYLHNNYIELLCDIGIVGAVFYYSMYGYILIGLAKNWSKFGDEANVIVILVLLQLIMDYGAVSYYSKQTYFYLMVFFIYIKCGHTRGNIYENKSICKNYKTYFFR
jgi:O-antigen ligase